MKNKTAEAQMFIYVRKQMGLSQRKMAVKLGVNQSSISKIESGVHRPRVSTIRKLERMAGKPAELLAYAALNMPVPAPTPQPIHTSVQKEAKVVKLNADYRKLKTKDLKYMHAKAFVKAYELDIKARRAALKFRDKALKSQLHRITTAYLKQQLDDANALNHHLTATNATQNLLEQVTGRISETSRKYNAEMNYGIHLPTPVELMRAQMKIDFMAQTAKYYAAEANATEYELHKRQNEKTSTGLAPAGRVVRLAASAFGRKVAM